MVISESVSRFNTGLDEFAEGGVVGVDNGGRGRVVADDAGRIGVEEGGRVVVDGPSWSFETLQNSGKSPCLTRERTTLTVPGRLLPSLS